MLESKAFVQYQPLFELTPITSLLILTMEMTSGKLLCSVRRAAESLYLSTLLLHISAIRDLFYYTTTVFGTQNSPVG